MLKTKNENLIIQDKELITFSNLTNLEWHFSELFNKEKNKYYTIKEKLSPENFIREYESNKDKTKKYTKYIYGEIGKSEVTKLDKQKGLKEMQQAAGIAMEYLEYSSRDKQEGYFLNDWEVVYAADNYKVTSEFLDTIYGAEKGEIKEENENVRRVYQTRAEVEKGKKTAEKINFGIKAVMIGSYMIPFCIGLRKAGGFKPLIKGGMNSIEKKGIKVTLEKALGVSKKKEYTRANKFLMGNMEKIIEKTAQVNGINQKTASTLTEEIVKTASAYSEQEISQELLEKLSEKILINMEKKGYKDGASDLARSIMKTFKPKEFLKEVKELVKSSRETGIASYVFNDLSVGSYAIINNKLEKLEEWNESQSIEEIEEIIEDISSVIIDAEIKICQDIVMYDTGFRVLVLKKEDTWIVAYKNGEDNEAETLPMEFDYLQIVYNTIKKKNEKQEIYFTGLDEGADLGLLSSLAYEEKAKLFYTNKPKIEGYFRFTPDDINREYKTTQEITISTAKGMGIEIGISVLIESVAPSVAGATVVGTVLPITIVVIVALAGLSWLISYFEKKQIETIFKKLEEDGFIKIKIENNKIKDAWIEDKFYETKSISLGDIKIKKEDYLFLMKMKKGRIDRAEIKDILHDVNRKYIIPIEDTNMIRQAISNYNMYILKKNEYGIFEIDGKVSTILFTGYAPVLMIGKPEEGILGIDRWSNGSLKAEDLEKFEKTLRDNIEKISSIEKNVLANIMRIIGILQRNIKKSNKNIEYIYSDYKNNRIGVSYEIKETLKNEFLKRFTNESIFLPYIDKETGNIGSEIREDYKKAVIKSAIAQSIYMETNPYKGYGNYPKIEKNIVNKKFDFQGEKVDEKLYILMNEYKNYSKSFFQRYNVKFINYDLEILENIKKDDLKNIYNLKRSNYNNGIINFIRKDDELKYSYNLKDYIINDLKIESKNLYHSNENKLFGSLGIDEEGIEKDYNFELSIDDKEKYTLSNGQGHIKLKDMTIGENIEKLKENLWFENKEDIEEYIEIIENEDEKISIRYIYDYNGGTFTDSELKIKYGKNDVYDNELIIENFKNGDYEIDLPRYHKLKGSLKNIECERKLKFEEEKENSDLKKIKWGGTSISLKINDGKKILVLGKSLEFIEKIEKNEDTIYKYQEISDMGWSDIENRVYYDYYLEDNSLDIRYGKLSKGINKYYNRIKIEEFKNGDYGINLSIDCSILYGSKYKKKEDEVKTYRFRNGFPMGNYALSNSKSKIEINGRYLSDEKILNNLDENEVKDEFKEIVKKIENDINSIHNFSMTGNFDNFYLYDTNENELLILYKSTLENIAEIKIKDIKYKIKLYSKLIIKNFVNGDYGLKLPINIVENVGLRHKEVYEIKEGDTLSKIAFEKLGDSNLWRNIEKDGYRPFTLKEAKRLKVGEKVYILSDK